MRFAGRSKGWGIVEFESPEEVNDAQTDSSELQISQLFAKSQTCDKIDAKSLASLTRKCSLQAVAAVNTFNGTDLAGRKIMVREDREDRDVKQYNR